jgi:Lon protease-like protein
MTPDNLPATIPIFPLPGILLLPGGQLPLHIFEPRYVAMTEDALASNQLIGMIQPEAEGTALQAIGCVGKSPSPEKPVMAVTFSCWKE